MSNQSNKQQEELAKLVEEAHLNIIKAIASTYTAEQLEVALTLQRRWKEQWRSRLIRLTLPLSNRLRRARLTLSTQPWEGDVDNNGGD